MIKDSEIIKMLKLNKSKGFELLFDRYYRPLVLFADKILNDMESSEDLIQDLFLKLYTKELYHNINENALASYLFQSAKNAAFNKLQKIDVLRNRFEIEAIDIVEEEVIRLNDESVKKLNEELNKLPERTGKVFHLIYAKKLKYKEAAAELGVSVNTIKTLLRNGLLHLKEVFRDREDIYMILVLRSFKINK